MVVEAEIATVDISVGNGTSCGNHCSKCCDTIVTISGHLIPEDVFEAMQSTAV